MVKNKTKKKINWHRIITLSAAGHYIQTQLNKELENVKKHVKKEK